MVFPAVCKLCVKPTDIFPPTQILSDVDMKVRTLTAVWSAGHSFGKPQLGKTASIFSHSSGLAEINVHCIYLTALYKWFYYYIVGNRELPWFMFFAFFGYGNFRNIIFWPKLSQTCTESVVKKKKDFVKHHAILGTINKIRNRNNYGSFMKSSSKLATTARKFRFFLCSCRNSFSLVNKMKTVSNKMMIFLIPELAIK